VSVGVKDGKIAFVGLEDQAVQAAKVIDATGKLVVPGGIEPHTPPLHAPSLRTSPENASNLRLVGG
jgi:imidazolonepropionase-like amidohydrolase